MLWLLVVPRCKRPDQHRQTRGQHVRYPAQDLPRRGVLGELLQVGVISQGDGGFRVGVDRCMLLLITDKARIRQGIFALPFAHGADAGGVEKKEDAPKRGTLGQDGGPGQAGLEAFEADPLQQAVLIDDLAAPLALVVIEVHLAAVRPRWAAHTIGAHHLATGSQLFCGLNGRLARCGICVVRSHTYFLPVLAVQPL